MFFTFLLISVTIMEKIRQTDYFAIIYLGGFVGLVTFFFILACSEIFCQNCLYRSSSNLFLPQAHCAHSYYTTPKPVTPPPPYHLFAPPQYIDIVKDCDRGKMVQCACPPGTPCPPYSRERTQGRSQGDRTDLVSIIQIEETSQPFQVTPAAPFISMLSGEAADSDKKNTSENSAANFENKTVENTEEIYIHRNPTEPILCSCHKLESGCSPTLQTSPTRSDNLVRQSISFLEYSTGQENLTALRNSISFNDNYLDRQNLISSDEKLLESTNPLVEDQSSFEQHSTSIERVNETEKTALSEFMKDNKQFRNQLKSRIRNSVSFSSSQNSNCSDQLEKQYKHSVSYTEQIDKAVDDHMSRLNLKQHQHSSCFAIGSLHHSIPELIKLSDDKVSSGFIGNSQQNQRTYLGSIISNGQTAAHSKDSLAEYLLDTSCIRLNNPTLIEEDCNKASPRYKTDLGLNNDIERGSNTCEQTTNTCDQATSTCYTWTNASRQDSADERAENLKTKIFFINDLDDDDDINEIS